MNKTASTVGNFVINYSGLICLIDCILLPTIVILLGILNVVSNFEHFERAAYVAELCLVLPFGFLSILINFKRSKNFFLFISGFIGIAVVVLSHFLESNILHTVFSLSGCLVLITSNFVSRKFYRSPEVASQGTLLV